MIPNIFISSTIQDLHYLRDGLREAVQELEYRPVMSEYGEVGYLSSGRASEACFRSIKECQIAVVIVGCRYGDTTEAKGISVTHKEFRTARDHGIPLIAFVEQQVLSYKEVFNATKGKKFWKKFPRMDNAPLTFALIDEIMSSESNNGVIPFTNVLEAKQRLKIQIAELVGQSLTQVFSPMRSEIKDVLAEIKTLRKEVVGHQKNDPRFLQAIRFIIDENKSKGLKYLAEHTLGPIDKSVLVILESSSFQDFINRTGYKLDVKDDVSVASSMKSTQMFGAMSFGVPSMENPIGTERADFIIRKNKTIEMNPAAQSHFDWVFHDLIKTIGQK